MKVLLTDEEIGDAINKSKQYHYIRQGLSTDRLIARAQIKAVVGWGNKPCSHDRANKGHTKLGRKRRECPVCWQDLLKEVEGK